MKGKNGFYPVENGYQHKFTVNGKRYSIRCKTISEGKDKEAEIREKIKNGLNLEKENMTLDKYYSLFEERRKEAGKIAASTIWNDRCRYDAYIKPYIGKKRVKDISLTDIEEMRRKLSKKLSTRTCNGACEVLSKVLKQAVVKDRIIQFNPCDGLERLKRAEVPTKQTIHRALTDDELSKLFTVLKGSYYEYFFLFLLNTGMRCSEALALNWSDIDEFNKCIHVLKTVSRIEANAFIVSKPKTVNGFRDIPLNAEMREILKKQREMLIALNSGAIPISGLVFPNTKGKMTCESAINSVLKYAANKAGIDRIGTHAFRDTYATKGAYSGVNRNTLAYLLGHCDPSVTDRYYVSVPDAEKREAVEMVRFAVSV